MSVDKIRALPIRHLRFVAIPGSSEAAVLVVKTTEGSEQSYVLTPKQMNWLAEELVTVANQLQPPTKQ